ncbi:Elongation factor 4 [Fagus crenata]
MKNSKALDPEKVASCKSRHVASIADMIASSRRREIFVSLSPPTLLNPTLLNPEEWKMLGGMEWWDKVKIPMRLIWVGVAKRLGIRKNGLLKLRQDVRTCEYEDVHVMWEILRRSETERIPEKSKKRSLWNFYEWARCTPYLCRSI